MRVFLTGGTGFIGQPLTRRLVARGWDVIALVRRPDSAEARALRNMGAHCVTGDITDRESMRAGMTGADLVVHNAGWYELGLNGDAKKRIQTINVGGTENVLGLAHELGIPRTVYVSSILAFGDSGRQRRDETFQRQAPCVTAYEQSKTDAHAVALQNQARGLPLIIACPGNVIGPNDHAAWGYFARLYVNGLMPPMGWAKDRIYVHATDEDTAEGIALAAEKGRIGETYLVCGETTTMQEVIDLWGSTPGHFRVRLWLPNKLAEIMFAPLEPLQRLLGLTAFISRETVRSSALNYHFSNEKAKRELGWNPEPVRELWLETMQRERELKAMRRQRDLTSRLRPLVEE
jgi:dihydroflavonol-4-reductase